MSQWWYDGEGGRDSVGGGEVWWRMVVFYGASPLTVTHALVVRCGVLVVVKDSDSALMVSYFDGSERW